MKKTKNTGFTIVELVVVIAVIAILVTVVIPGFSEIIARAKLSKDITFCSSLNKTFASGAFEEQADSAEEVINLLLDKGYSLKDFIPSAKDHYYVYDFKNNRIALINQNFEISYQDVELSDDLWILVDSEETAQNIAKKNLIVCGFLLVKSDKAIQISLDKNLVEVDESTIQEVIDDSTSVDNVVKFKISKDFIDFNIFIGETNAITLDLSGNDLKGVVFRNGLIKNYGELQIINGNISNHYDACIIENYGKLVLNNVTLQSHGTNSVDATIVNLGRLYMTESCIFSTSTSCVINKETGNLIVSGGNYEADCGSNIINYGTATVNDGTFVRKVNNAVTGSSGSYYAVIENRETNACFTINGGSFVNEYVTAPSRRYVLVLYNDNGEMEINNGEFINKCNNAQAYVIWTKNPKSKMNIFGGKYAVSNENAYWIYSSSRVVSTNIVVSNISIYGTQKIDSDAITITNKFFFYNYLKGDISCVVLTDIEPMSYGARLDNNFYLDVDLIESKSLGVGSVVILNQTPTSLKIVLDRKYLGISNGISVVYGKEISEIVFVAKDYVMQKTDLKTNYPNAFSAFKYYSYISSETATFKAEYDDGKIDYFSFDDWDIACQNTSKLTLLKDVDRVGQTNVKWSGTNNMILDLNGKTWKESGDVDYLLYINYGNYTLSIVDESMSKTGSMVFEGKPDSYGLFFLLGSINICGGSFISNGNVFYIFGTNDNINYDFDWLTYKITGGRFIGKIYQQEGIYHGQYSFEGGVFSDNPSAYLAKNCTVSINSEGLYSVVLRQYFYLRII